MSNITVDARGDQCPIPVIKTKKALAALPPEGGVVEVRVDNEIAVQNLTKMARQKQLQSRSEKLAEQDYQVVITVAAETQAAANAAGTGNENAANTAGAGNKAVANAAGVGNENAANTAEAGNNATANPTRAESQTAGSANPAAEAAGEPAACFPDARTGTVAVVSSATMGTGNDELGKVLMKGFFYALSQLDELPQTILFYNGGATLTTEGSDSLEDLKSMEAQGVEILTCGTCLNYYGLSEKLQVGGVTNMYTIVEKMAEAGKIIRP